MREIMVIELSDDLEHEIELLEDMIYDTKDDLFGRLLEWWQMNQISRDEGTPDVPELDASEIEDINSLISRTYNLSIIVDELRRRES